MAPNWNKIKTEYLRGGDGATFRGLAAKHGVSESTLTKRAIRESWADERQQVRSAVAAELPGAVAQQVKKELADYLAAGLSALDTALTITSKKIEAGDLEFKSLGEAIATLTRVVKTQAELADLAGAESEATSEGGPPNRLVIVDPSDGLAGSLSGLPVDELTRLYREACQEGREP